MWYMILGIVIMVLLSYVYVSRVEIRKLKSNLEFAAEENKRLDEENEKLRIDLVDSDSLTGEYVKQCQDAYTSLEMMLDDQAKEEQASTTKLRGKHNKQVASSSRTKT